jgi:hypothetical protein
MALLFHQNMRTFGGNEVLRNNAYATAFNAVRAAAATMGAGWGPYRVMGFTELMNAGVGMRTNLLALARNLSPLTNRLLLVNVGTMAVSGNSEYVGIAWRQPTVNVQHVGRVLWRSDNRTWNCYNHVGALPTTVIPAVLPQPAVSGLGLDTRGLAYIAGLFGGNPHIFGFMHNMYGNGNRSGAFASLGVMAQLVRNAIGGIYSAARVFIGGDFNVDPRPPDYGVLFHRGERMAPGGAFVNTTLANAYDFWLVSNIFVPDADARVRFQTRRPPATLSDHAGVDLRIS